MKIIFLDVDGVLNVMSDSYRTFMKPYGQHIEAHLVSRLNYIIEKTDSHVVVSSSWKSDMDDLELQMTEQGFKYWDKVIGRTPFSGEMGMPGLDSGLRGLQIEKWMKDSDVEIDSFVVLEDEVCDVCGSKCDVIPKISVVEIDMNEGISHANAIDSIDILLNRDLVKRDTYMQDRIDKRR